MDRITDLLQQKPLEIAIKEIIKKVKKFSDRTLDLMIIQFFIEYLGSSFEIDEEDLEELESSTEYKNLAEEIYLSDEKDEFSAEIPMVEFIERMNRELFIHDCLSHTSITCWIEILSAFIENDKIPEEAIVKPKAHVLLTCMLYPLADILFHEGNNLAITLNENLKESIEGGIERIMVNVEQAFKYESFSSECTKHLKNAILHNPQCFIKNVDGIKFIKRLLTGYDDRTQLATTLSLLNDLCKVGSLHDILKDFLFSPIIVNNEEEYEYDIEKGEEQTVIDKIFELIHHKNLKSEVFNLIKTIAQHITNDEDQFLSQQQRLEISLNIFNKNKKTSMETFSVMEALNMDFWLEVIKMINFYMDPNEIDITYILTTYDGQPQEFLDIACNHVNNDTITSQRAAQLFLQSLKITDKGEEMLTHVTTPMCACIADPKTFLIIFDFLYEINREKLVEYFKEKVNLLTNLIELLTKIFETLEQNPVFLKKTVEGFYLFFKISPQFTLQKVYKVFMEHLNIFVSTSQYDDPQTINAVIKLSALLEIRYWSILQNRDLLKLYKKFDYFKENYNGIKNLEIFPHIIRLLVNFFKHYWMKVVKQDEDIYLSNQELDMELDTYFQLLRTYSKDKTLPLNAQCMALASYMDFILLFQPKMKDLCNANVFKIYSLNLSKKDLIGFVDEIEMLVFHDTTSTDIFYKKLLLQSFVSFYCNFRNLPSNSVWEVCLRYYNNSSPYKKDIEDLMKNALDKKKEVFDKSSAFAILNISNFHDIDIFKQFYVAFENFLKIHEQNDDDRKVRLALICSYILEKLPLHIQEHKSIDRFIILDFVTIIVKNFDTQIKNNLLKYATMKNVKLTTAESQKFEAFRNMLKE